MPYKVETISVEGIRGFNKSEKVTFGEGITLLYGENGSGKTSLLQSIEWALTGGIPYMKGGDFAREDAIVNLFNKSKKALVEISLRNQNSTIVLKRTRKMSSRTTSGKQPLELHLANKILKDEEAETELERILKIDLESFSQSKYLHQETIREILHAKPEERSQAIDKLLGTFEVREFAKTLDIDRRVKNSIETLQRTMDSLRRDKIQFHLNLKRSVEKTKASIICKGYTEEELTLSSVLRKMEQSRTDVELLKERYGTVLRGSLKINPDAQILIEAHRTLLSQLNDLDRSRLEAVNRINSQRANLESNAKRYHEVFEQLDGMRRTDTQTLEARIKRIDEELDGIGSKIRDFRQKLASLPHKRHIYETNKKKLEVVIGKLDAIREKYGTMEIVQDKIKKCEEQLRSIQSDLEKLSDQQRLITLAIDYLDATKTKECPVCLKIIDNERLIEELKTKVSDEITKSTKKLEESKKKINAERRTLDETIEESGLLSGTIEGLEKSLATSEEEIRELVPHFGKINLDEVTKDWEKEIKGLTEKESELREEQNRLKDTLKRLSQLSAELEQLQVELQKDTSSGTEGPKLLKEVGETIRVLDEEIGKYTDSSAIDTLRKTLSDLTDVLNCVRDEEQVQAAEKELPLIEKQIKDLEARTNGLKAFASSLQSIRQLTTAYEKDASITQLKRLEDGINMYYSMIHGHPHFTRLKIDVEKEDPIIFSVRAASTQEGTYIPTRFSTAQLNAVALSIFVAYSDQQVGDLPIIIFDDPTQSMDSSHKESFAKLVATLPPKYQVIIATEDDDTRGLLEKHCTGIKTYEFRNWAPEGAEVEDVKVE